MATLRLEVRGDPGEVTLRDFLAAMDCNLRMLADYDRALSGEPKGSLRWYVDRLENGSLDVVVESRSQVKGVNFGPDVAREHVRGWDLIEREGATPPYLTEAAMHAARRVTRLIGRNGVYGFAVSHDDQTTEVTVRAAAHIAQLVTVQHQALGSVEGTIETVSIHGGRRFIVYHSQTKKAITCSNVAEDWLRRSGEYLGRRVSVVGTVYRNGRGEPMRVDVARIRVLREPHELPSVRSLTGSRPDLTGNLSTEEYLQEIRGG